MDEKCDTSDLQNDVRDPLPSSMPCGNKQGSAMQIFGSKSMIDPDLLTAMYLPLLDIEEF
ncbi:hypothetical protein AHAS_Ahas02G0120500 [Arachis hypogaea]